MIGWLLEKLGVKVKGKKRHYCKITQELKKEILDFYYDGTGHTYDDVAFLVGCSPSTVGKVIREYKNGK